ncbi:hypothetical protein [Amycolatopsis nigrescens]|uniref:hypothetical protein n=1 Tax=Amycolatopsis nigrescens TaxID=381445 RepID=UPI000375C5C2|nr:hypothetical protein [Amycolatopsis nigrescens]
MTRELGRRAECLLELLHDHGDDCPRYTDVARLLPLGGLPPNSGTALVEELVLHGFVAPVRTLTDIPQARITPAGVELVRDLRVRRAVVAEGGSRIRLVPDS